MPQVLIRVRNKVRRTLAETFACRMLALGAGNSIITFSFDDAPITAFTLGRKILARHGARPTYFVSLGLLGTHTEVGPIGSLAHLKGALRSGCELGCHTFDHLDAWHASAADFLASIQRNREELQRLLPGQRFASFAYPKSGARLTVKPSVGEAFRCSRGGGQALNVGAVDRNLVKACFLDRRTGIDLAFVRRLVDHNAAHGGWLVFATHDISDEPTRYGCTPEFLAAVAEISRQSGALLLPFTEACDMLMTSR